MSIKIASVLALCTSMAIAAPAIWDGTADVSWYVSSAQAYNLKTAEQLAGLAKLVNQGTSSFEGKTITLGADIFLNDTAGVDAGTWASVPHTEWTPIGTSSRPFKGEFDGIAGKKNRKIYGLYVNDATKDYVGLFGYTSNVKISNLDVLVGRITAKDNVGALVGYAEGGSVTNVHSEVKVTGNNHVGGLVGYFTGNLSASSVKENVVGQDSVGGLVGYISGSVAGSSKDSSFFIGDVNGRKFVGGAVGLGSSISKTYVKGNVQGDSSYVGGLAGYATGAITTSYHEEGDVSGAGYVGGLAGYTTGAVTGSHSEGNVTGTGNHVGGLVGQSYFYYSGSSALTIVVADSSYSIGNVKGAKYVGGLIGLDSIYRYSNNTYRLERQIKRSYAQGIVEGTQYTGGVLGKSIFGYRSSSYSSGFYSTIRSVSHTDGTVLGSTYVGGLVGYTYGTVTGSHTEGTVTGTGDYVGGLVGQGSAIDSSHHEGGEVSGAGYVGGLAGYSTGTVTGSHSEGNVTGTSDCVGGLIGYSYYQYSGGFEFTAITAQNSYAIGNVKGVNYVGGLVGYDYIYRYSDNNRTLVKKISNSHSVGNVIGNGKYVGGVIGKSAYGYKSTYPNISLQIHSSYHEGSVKGYSSYVGGVAGEASGSIDSSYHIGGDISGSSYGGSSYVGGLAGYTTGTVTGSHSEGIVTGTGNYVGGLVGRGKVIDSSYHEGGDVTGQDSVGGLVGFGTTIGNSYHDSGIVSGKNYVGGLAGYTTGTVTGSHSEGIVTGTGNYVGGLVGRGAAIEASYHEGGDVTGTSNYVGGLVGSTSSWVKNSHSEGNVTGKSFIGGLIGAAGGNVDSSSHVEGDVTGTSYYVGGLVGSTSSWVKNSHSEGNVTGKSYVGGLIGDVSGVIRSANNSIDLSNHTGGDVSGSSYVGGLVGSTCSFVTNSYSEGDVTGSSDRVGGVAGSVTGKIRNSYAVAKHVRGGNLVGGLAGYVEDSIDVSYFEGDSVTGFSQIGGLAGYAEKTVDSSYSTANVKGDDNVGGLIGSAYGDVSNSYAIGNVVGDVEHSSAGCDNLGGLVGYQYSGSVSKSMALGNVSGTTKLGGLVGRFDGTSISNSYANGDVTGSYYGDPADEVGNYYIGGLVGYAKGSLSETYASGVVKGMEDEPVYTGCIVGYVNGSLNITKSYYDKTKCSLGVDGGEETATVTGSPDKTTTEMQTQSTFVNWDFVDTWKIYENTYPFLKIFTNSLTNAVVTTASLENIVYDGSAKTPIVTSVELFGETLTYGTDYTVAYKNNVDAGTATINVCGVNPYGGCKAINFVINAAVIVPTIASIEDVTYSGVALTPEIRAYNGGTLLTDADYTVEYADNLNAGTASVTVTLKGNYSGSATKKFTIKKATPVISQNPTASNVVNGQTLASSELTGGSADVEGAFVWQVPETVPTLENDGYIAVFVPTDTLNYDSVETTVPVEVLDYVYVAVHVGDETLDSAVVIKGGNYTLPNAPDSVGYDFVGLYKGNAIVGNPGDVIVLNENTVIEAIYEAKTFAITFVNGDVVLQSENTAYGTLPEYRGETPTKTATAQYTYTFKGWNPAIASVTGAATYTAVFDSTVNKYMVTFKDGEIVLQSGEVAYGTVPTAPAVTLPENTAQYTYSFGGWDSEVVAVTGPATYTAVINRTLNKYEVVFKDYDGSVLKSAVEYDYGTSADNVVKPSDPTRESTAQYTYTFKGWNPSIADVTEAAIYTAEYDSTVRSYEIAFVNGSRTLQSGAVEYGQTPVYTGNIPTKTATAQYTYTFKGWNPTITSVTGAATYTAVFDSTVNKYMVTFKDGETVLQSGEVAYGTVPTAPAVTLPESTAQYSYSFDGWDSEIVAVTGPATYTAVINRALNRYGIVFKD